ncbi:alpha/beta fold hydrolase [Paenibacillus harenae]|uniref:alpha/beta fold hydrolase n=1 Tax=Paenibacillus harenae TaxID=306543 RepID=UPI00278F522C|nr:alpha/beta hydrolase [Paenibacillus harenae]MDQ0058664.1 pimeloyl-ACP methyl ester carboxylesterase [Paenibacillus harenae]
MFRSRILNYNQARIAYYMSDEHNTDKDTLLLLHAAFADHELFEPQWQAFAADYHLIAIDMPGHGISSTQGSDVTLKDMPEIINLLLTQLRIDKPIHILGVSLGSLVAQAYADRHPERVRSVIAVGGYSIHKANEQVLKAQRKEGLRWVLYVLLSMNRFRAYVTKVSCFSEQGRELFRRGMDKFDRRSFAAMAGMNALFVKRDNPMPYPLLLLSGTHDRQLAKEAAARWHSCEPKSNLILLPNAGHCANVDAPDEFNVLLAQFLSAQRTNR